MFGLEKFHDEKFDKLANKTPETMKTGLTSSSFA
jgi:hypothetical protein